MSQLPKFWEVAETKIKLERSSRVVSFKIDRRTCDMMIEAERNDCAGLNPDAYRKVVEVLRQAEVVLRTRRTDRVLHETVIQALSLAQEVT